MHKRTKALQPTKDAKDAAWERDRGRCVWCEHTGIRTGFPGLPEAHFIPRSKSGLGIEQNILTLCRPCHDRFDNGKKEYRDYMRKYFRSYLKAHYPGWDEKKLVYRRFDNDPNE